MPTALFFIVTALLSIAISWLVSYLVARYFWSSRRHKVTQLTEAAQNVLQRIVESTEISPAPTLYVAFPRDVKLSIHTYSNDFFRIRGHLIYGGAEYEVVFEKTVSDIDAIGGLRKVLPLLCAQMVEELFMKWERKLEDERFLTSGEASKTLGTTP